MEESEKSRTADELTMAFRGTSQRTMPPMSGDIVRAYRRNLPSDAECQSVNVGRPTARPVKGLDWLRLKWRKGYGALIVVGDGESPLHGEGAQRVEETTACVDTVND
jgi:hypothetical protein